jgi:hypothetical protein
VAWEIRLESREAMQSQELYSILPPASLGPPPLPANQAQLLSQDSLDIAMVLQVNQDLAHLGAVPLYLENPALLPCLGSLALLLFQDNPVQPHSLVSQVLLRMMVRVLVVALLRAMGTADKMVQHLADRNPALIPLVPILLVHTHPARILPALVLPEATHSGPRARRALGHIPRVSLRMASLQTDSHQEVEYPAVKAIVRQAVREMILLAVPATLPELAMVTILEVTATTPEAMATTLLAETVITRQVVMVIAPQVATVTTRQVVIIIILVEAMAIILRVTTPTILRQRNKLSLLAAAIIHQVVTTTTHLEVMATTRLEVMAIIPVAMVTTRLAVMVTTPEAMVITPEAMVITPAETAIIHLAETVTTLLEATATTHLEVMAIILRVTTPTILQQRNKPSLQAFHLACLQGCCQQSLSHQSDSLRSFSRQQAALRLQVYPPRINSHLQRSRPSVYRE